MTNKLNPGKRTEAAIKKWLGLPKGKGLLAAQDDKGLIILYGAHGDAGDPWEEIGRFTLASLIKKRYPRRKKK